MSAIIKSNVAFTGQGYPVTYAQLSTSYQEAFTAYKSRVVADGGVVNDDAATLNAFKFLFDNKIMGKVNTFISPKFGVKLDGGGGVLKAYSIDGGDLEGLVFGTGALPKIADNYFKFNATNTELSTTNGGILTTADKKLRVSKQNRCAQGFKVRNVGFAAAAPLSQFTNHLDYALAATVFGVIASKSGEVGAVFYRHVKPPFSTSSTALDVAGASMTLDAGGTTVVYTFDGLENLSYTYKDGIEKTQQSYAREVADITTTEFYIDVGGMYKSATNKIFTNIELSCLINVKDFERATAIAINNYIHTNH